MAQKEGYLDFDEYIHEYEQYKLNPHTSYKSRTEKSPEESAQMVNDWIQCADVLPALPSKCKNCTLEEIAVLRIIQNEPAATHHYIAFEIGKPECIIQIITSHLINLGILDHTIGKRGRVWQINYDELGGE